MSSLLNEDPPPPQSAASSWTPKGDTDTARLLHTNTSQEDIPIIATTTDNDDDDDDDNGTPTTLFPSSMSKQSMITAGAVANLCSATLGAGILALPHAMARAGIIPGIGLLAVAGVATTASIRLLVQAVAVYRQPSYEQLTMILFGPKAAALVKAGIVLFCQGCAVAYLIAIADILQGANLLMFHDSRALTMCVVWLVVCLPLSLLRRMQTLQAASAVGMAAIGTLLFAALIHLMEDWHAKYEHHHHHHDHHNQTDDSNSTNHTFRMTMTDDDYIINDFYNVYEDYSNATSNSTSTSNTDDDVWWPLNGTYSVLQACPVILFAFSCQVNVCAIFLELPVLANNHENNTSPEEEEEEEEEEDGDEEANGNTNGNNNNEPSSTSLSLLYHPSKVPLMQGVAVRSVLVCTVLYAAMAWTTLADFGPSHVQPNMLQNYNLRAGVMQVAAAGMAVAVCMAFPLNIFPSRVTCLTLFPVKPSTRGNNNNNNDTNRRRQSTGTGNPDLTEALLQDYYDESGQEPPEEPDYGYEEHVPDAELDENEEMDDNDEQNEDEDVSPPLAPRLAPQYEPPATNEVGDENQTNDDEIEQEGFENEYNDADLPFDWVRHVVWTLILSGSALGLALVLPNISVVFSVLGGTTSSWLGFCVPGLLGLRLERDATQKSWVRYLVSWCLLLGGIAVGILTTVLTVQSITGHGQHHSANNHNATLMEF